MEKPRSNPPSRCAFRLALCLGLAFLWASPASGEDGKPKSAAERLWDQAMKATEAGQWDMARAILQQFLARHAGDPRAEEARRRCSGNAVLKIVPFCLNGPEENRIDAYVGADALPGTQEGQDRLKGIATALIEEGLCLPPFDAYWSYFNWHVVHAGSAGDGKDPAGGGTCFGGRLGGGQGGGKDASLDWDVAAKAAGAFPGYDMFLCHVKGWNGWPHEELVMSAVGTCNLRYVPRILSGGRLQDAEIHAEIFLFPEQRAAFDRTMLEFKAKWDAAKPAFAKKSVREWREWTASRNPRMIRGQRGGKMGRRDSGGGPERRVCWRITDALNQFVDWTAYPSEMDVKARPFPPIDNVPWFHWLLRGDPTVTVVPSLKCAYSETRMEFLKFREDGGIELVYPEGWSQKAEALKRQNGGKMPDTAAIKRNLFITYIPHDQCHLGGAALPEKGGIGGAPLYCAACREEAVRAIYRYVNPVDDRSPREESVPLTDPKAPLEFAVFPMQPLDHALTVEWRLDGAPCRENVKKGWVLRKSGKKTGPPPSFPVKARKREYFDASESGSSADQRQVEAAMARSRVAAFETLTVRPAELAPGPHAVEALVVDETPWVLWDPENLLSETVKWTFTAPEREGK